MKLKGGFEPEVLKSIKKHDVKVEYESERLPYTTVQHRRYIPDFVITLADGRKVYVEAKGYFRPDDRKKLLAVREAHPDKDIRLVFKQDNKISSKSPTRYSDWCDKYKWIYCIGGVPEEWFK